MTTTLIGYARCSTDKQDLSAQQAALIALGVASDRIYTDHGLTGTNRSRPGLDQALAAVRCMYRKFKVVDLPVSISVSHISVGRSSFCVRRVGR